MASLELILAFFAACTVLVAPQATASRILLNRKLAQALTGPVAQSLTSQVAQSLTGQIRVHYLSIGEVEWNYAPGDGNLCTGSDFTDLQATYVDRGNATAGRLYTKAVYRAYTDASFSELAPVPPAWSHLGILGPPIHAEEGDTIVIVLRNTATFEFGLHLDGTTEVDAKGLPLPLGILGKWTLGRFQWGTESVPPGSLAISAWGVTDQSAPGPADESSTLYLYRSTVAIPGDAQAGLVGPLIVTRRGAAAPDGTPLEVDREFVVLFQIMNENDSPYKNDALLSLGTETNETEIDFSPGDAAMFEEGNKKHSMNGYVFCNLPGLEMTQGDRVRWYLVAVGNEADLHTPHWHGNTGVLSNGTERVDQFNLLPLNIRVMDMRPDAVGTWMFHCHVNDHILAGMVATYTVKPNPAVIEPLLNGTVRQYYIQVEELLWNYAPAGKDLCSADTLGSTVPFPNPGSNFTNEQLVFVGSGPNRVGSIYRKASYVEYADSTFRQVKVRAPEWEHLGLLGPVLRAEVGDEIRITLRNRAQFNFSMHPHGVFYTKASEGNSYNDSSQLDRPGHGIVPPGGEYNYTWLVPERAGPGSTDTSSTVWLYHSHVDEVGDTNGGLVGVIVVTRKGAARGPDDPTPKDVDREFVTFFSVLDENKSVFATNNTVDFALRGNATNSTDLAADEEFNESNLMHSVNGFVYCNLPGLSFRAGDRVRWYVVALGTEVDVHSPTWGGHAVVHRGVRAGSTLLLPAAMATLDMTPAVEAGVFNFQCHVDDHYLAGMKTMFQVLPTQAVALAATSPGRTYTHYIAADPILWDYAPAGKQGNCGNLIAVPLEDAATFLATGPNRIGKAYHKAVYREYSSDSFSVPLNTSVNEGGRGGGQPGQHLGLLGPLLRAQPGDTIKIVFKNNLNISANIVPQGPFTVRSLGPSTTPDVGAPVAPGDVASYEWVVTSAAGPGPSDGSSILWHYQSTVDSPQGVYAGLLGPVIITARGMDRGASVTEQTPPLMAKDVDRELVTVFGIFNENLSPFLDQNRLDFAPGVNASSEEAEDEGFEESNLMHGINFHVYCNVLGLEARAGERVRWHTLGIGSELDLHTPNWGGELTVTRQGGKRAVSLGLLSGIAESADTVALEPIEVLYHCGVHDHLAAGMQARFAVV